MKTITVRIKNNTFNDLQDAADNLGITVEESAAIALNDLHEEIQSQACPIYQRLITVVTTDPQARARIGKCIAAELKL